MDEGGMSSTGLIVIFLALVVMIVSIAFLVFWLLEKKDDEKRAREKSARFHHFNRLNPAEAEVHVETRINKPITEPQDEHGISRLLDGDERNMYQLIASSGGEILQRNLVEKKVFSKAKVTRLLDKLESRGLIRRERYGSTNKIRLIK